MYSSSSESRHSNSTQEDLNSQFYFVYPNARPPRLCNSANLPRLNYTSDSSLSDGQLEREKRRSRKKTQKPVLLAPVSFPAPAETKENSYISPSALPPVGVFWDIENCQVPKHKSATNIVQKIRLEFCEQYREAEFMVVCDVKKENAQVIQDLHDAQVNLIHVQSTSKNAADEKLRQSLRRFAEIYQAPAAVVLISSDINFCGDLSELRYRKKLHVILVHNVNVADALVLCADETYLYSSLVENVPQSRPKISPVQYTDLLISNLPINFDRIKVRQRLKLLSDNCGGKVYDMDPDSGTAILRFSTVDYAMRAQKRLKGEDVYGFKIKVKSSNLPRESPCRNFQPRRMKNSDTFQAQSSFQGSSYGYAPEQNFQQQYNKDSWRYREQDHLASCNTSNPEPNRFQSIRPVNTSSTTKDQLWTSCHGAFADCRNRNMDEETNGAYSLPVQNTPKVLGSPVNFSDEKNFYQNGNAHKSIKNNNPVDLIITNIDSAIDLKDVRSVLSNILEKYVMVQSLNVTTQPDGTPIATLKVRSQQEAQFAISQVHHYKLGYKRLNISYVQNNTLDPVQLREMVVALLQEVPGNRMPLFKLIELFESRFHTNVSVSEISKLKDICKIMDDVSGRIICLAPDIRSSPPCLYGRTSMLYCTVHCPNGMENKGWGEPELTQLPNINMPLKDFSQKLNDLLTAHLETLPLLSLPVCYEAVFNEQLPTSDNGVPLEHLVTCVHNVELKYGGPSKNIKYISRELKLNAKEAEDAILKTMSPSIISNIQLLCRELVDLLKTTERCQILLNRFIPFYHHHFGRQCRVADYGYTKLVELFESQIISNVVQIIGEGQKRTITLTHATQMRRFTSDLLRVLKSQVSKQLSIKEFSVCYERAMSKPFNAFEYGLCNLEDLLEEVPENTVVINNSSDSVIISIPKREQTAEEIMRTKQFADEVVKLLRYSPQCSMLFNKFVPAYHHHFGHQCKVSDYGFTKLIELFEAIPDTVRVEELPDGERRVSLTLPKALQVLGNQIMDLIKRSELSSLPLVSLSSTFLREYGYALKPSAYECSDVNELVSKLSDFVQIVYSNAGPLVVLVDSESESTVTIRIWSILLKPPYSLEISEFITTYRNNFQCNITIGKLEQMKNVCEVNKSTVGTFVILKPLYSLAAEIYDIICSNGGQIQFNQLEMKYRRKMGKSLCPSDYNFNTLEELLSEISFLIMIRGSRKRMCLFLNQQLTEYGMPCSNDNGKLSKMSNQLQWPPAPVYDIVSNIYRTTPIAPPKPDTPPAPGSAPWSQWNTPCKSEDRIDLCIKMPAVQTNLLGNPGSLISPTKNLLPATSYSLGNIIPIINAPDPSELPMPDKLLGKVSGGVSDDSADSGVINNSHLNSENEMDTSSENGTKGKLHTCSKSCLQVNM